MITQFKFSRFLFAYLLVVTSLAVPRFASAGASNLSDRLAKSVQASGFKNGEIGIWVGTTSDEGKLKTVFQHNGSQLFIPASLSKIVTMGAVLSTLQPGFKFKTQLLFDPAQAKIVNGTLTGSIYLKGGGDPSFVSENMWFLVNELTRAGVSKIEGDVVVDDSRFDKIRFGDDRQDERVDRAYDAPIGAMSMNWNAVNVYVRAGDKAGIAPKVFADVASPYLKVVNNAHTTGAGKGKSISVERTSEKGFKGDVITVSGGIALDQPELVIYKSISQPDLWAGYNLIEFLRQRGIEVKGTVTTGEASAKSLVLATSESHPLSSVVTDMAKWSNNFVAESLVKNLAAESGEHPATMDGGLVQVRKFLQSVGLKSGEYEFVNAAGFTRKNKLTPEQLGRVLERVHSDFTIFPEYVTALPIGGVDGTLRSRMKNTAAEHWVRAKTGLLNGVVGLAGFAGQKNGSVLTFTCIYNGAGREDKARAFFDHFAATLVGD